MPVLIFSLRRCFAVRLPFFFIILARRYNHSQVRQFTVGLVSTAIIKYRVPSPASWCALKALRYCSDTQSQSLSGTSVVRYIGHVFHVFTATNVLFTKVVSPQLMTLLRFNTIIFRYISSGRTLNSYIHCNFPKSPLPV